MDNCIFLSIGGGICPKHSRKCDKPCEKYVVIGDDSKQIFYDWNEGIEKLASELKHKYFEINENSVEDKEVNEIDSFLGGVD